MTGEIGQLVHLTVEKELRPEQEPALTPPRSVVAPIVLEKELKHKDAMQTTVLVRPLSLDLKSVLEIGVMFIAYLYQPSYIM